MPAPLTLEVYDKNFRMLGPIGAPKFITAIPRCNTPGQLTFAVRADHPRVASLLEPGHHVRCLDARGNHVISGWVSSFRGTGPERASLLEFNVIDHLAVLRYVLGWVNPSGTIDQQGVAGSNWTMNGPAETVLKAAVVANAVNRLGLPIDVPGSRGLGKNVKAKLRFQPLFDRLFPTVDGAGIEDSGIIVSMELVPDEGLRLQVRLPVTRTPVLNERSGVVREWSFTQSAPTVTRAVVGGQGEAQLRMFREKALPALESEIGWKLEAWRDARDTDDPTVLYERLDETIADGGLKTGLSIALSETKNFRYGTNASVGDIVTIGVAGRTFTEQLKEVTLSWTADGGFVSRPRIGERTDDPDKQLAKSIYRLARSIMNRNTEQ